MPDPRRPHAVLRAGVTSLAASFALLAGTFVGTFADESASAAGPDAAQVYLVTLRGAGTAGADTLVPTALRSARMLDEQDVTLQSVDAPEPLYRWTTALNGYAVQLSSTQAASLESDLSVASVEPNEVRTLAGVDTAALAAQRIDADRPSTGGAGIVIGIIDTGLAPESPLFAQVRHQRTSTFSGACPEGQSWASSECNGKVAGARWYVRGFGTDNLRATSSLSPRDTDGHGTQMASIAAGNAAVPVTVGGERLGRLGGLAPAAQLAVYKACWGAPDPDDDGCATADLVTAIDDATRDGVDVLSLSVAGPGAIDTVERALLGAAESGIVVIAAAGNDGQDAYAAHPSPWVTTVGGASGDVRQGRVVVPKDLRSKRLSDLSGPMLSGRTIGPAPVVLGAEVPAIDVRRRDAAVCAPDSLDAALVADAVVVCKRGQVGRIDKSRAVEMADGVGMVLVNQRRGSVDLDVHSVPSVHLDDTSGSRLTRWVRRHPGERLTLRSLGKVRGPARVAALSPMGNPSAGIVKPDLLAPATSVLGAVPSDGGGDGWAFVSGTSAATAYTAGVAATLLSQGDRASSEVRSMLATTAAPVDNAIALRSGAGLLRPDRVRSPGLAYLIEPGDYREWLDGSLSDLNTPSALIAGNETTRTRTVTNVGKRRLYFSSSARGFDSGVSVSPAALRLGPGETATYTITVDRRSPTLDDGFVVWRGATGTVTRIPVVIGR
ncbi:MAG: S8 family serine peptidase [Nocardioides sp.]